MLPLDTIGYTTDWARFFCIRFCTHTHKFIYGSWLAFYLIVRCITMNIWPNRLSTMYTLCAYYAHTAYPVCTKQKKKYIHLMALSLNYINLDSMCTFLQVTTKKIYLNKLTCTCLETYLNLLEKKACLNKLKNKK